ncbi:hypothetical protein ebA6025 [Aromatoleum aromaticum EbN1]|uniref:Uncharacterized protein n=1 Tax=Aromatoleum aromaticum (strain DSM 19018 / LMG 30748 / EbN1) TaxID=76114 RepID=Q5NZF1_AROAE|nr:hypothetical protein ebA6025 [Aromatoleum aromaticum EbN1]
MPCTDLSHDHADRDTHAPDARFAAHHPGLLADPIKLSHGPLLSKPDVRVVQK